MGEILSIDDAQNLICRALEKNDVAPQIATIVAKALVGAEIDGQKGHGFSRVASYAAQAKSGKVDGNALPSVKKAFEASVIVDARNGFAFPAIDAAIEATCQLVDKTGIAFAGIFRSHHCGQLGAHVERVAERGYLAIMVSNSPKAMAPWGGAKPLFGTNPIAFAAPRVNNGLLVVDLSLSKVARGKVMAAAKAGESIPEGWALDANGQPTTDPNEALKGTMVPAGDAKGAALALMVEVLSATLVGANHSYEATSFFDAEGAPPGIGHTLIVLNPMLATSRSYFDRIENLISEILQQDGTRLPGGNKLAARNAAMTKGISIASHLLDEIKALS
ncbi:Ldh family oxidoreductase [Maritalea porphyrae]|uniref:Sulfolactate dehydrogenase n=1 Tax=Maritalea porphyrae TaxID=880732 RepID=A0ABQ5UP61_9HYPH|nr:Ldh family oxidoreductase [Maritalea porphyrae]GLQ17073.1 sulfolactate dehydrogenase [Maritalea porphyrae]